MTDRNLLQQEIDLLMNRMPNTEEARRLRGYTAAKIAFEKYGDIDTAKRHLKMYLQERPDNIPALLLMGDIYSAKHDYLNSFQCYDKIYAMYSSKEILLKICNILYHMPMDMMEECYPQKWLSITNDVYPNHDLISKLNDKIYKYSNVEKDKDDQFYDTFNQFGSPLKNHSDHTFRDEQQMAKHNDHLFIASSPHTKNVNNSKSNDSNNLDKVNNVKTKAYNFDTKLDKPSIFSFNNKSNTSLFGKSLFNSSSNILPIAKHKDLLPNKPTYDQLKNISNLDYSHLSHDSIDNSYPLKKEIFSSALQNPTPSNIVINLMTGPPLSGPTYPTPPLNLTNMSHSGETPSEHTINIQPSHINPNVKLEDNKDLSTSVSSNMLPQFMISQIKSFQENDKQTKELLGAFTKTLQSNQSIIMSLVEQNHSLAHSQLEKRVDDKLQKLFESLSIINEQQSNLRNSLNEQQANLRADLNSLRIAFSRMPLIYHDRHHHPMITQYNHQLDEHYYGQNIRASPNNSYTFGSSNTNFPPYRLPTTLKDYYDNNHEDYGKEGTSPSYNNYADFQSMGNTTRFSPKQMSPEPRQTVAISSFSNQVLSKTLVNTTSLLSKSSSTIIQPGFFSFTSVVSSTTTATMNFKFEPSSVFATQQHSLLSGGLKTQITTTKTSGINFNFFSSPLSSPQTISTASPIIISTQGSKDGISFGDNRNFTFAPVGFKGVVQQDIKSNTKDSKSPTTGGDIIVSGNTVKGRADISRSFDQTEAGDTEESDTSTYNGSYESEHHSYQHPKDEPGLGAYLNYANGWTCDACYIVNALERNKCIACDTSRDGATKKSPDTVVDGIAGSSLKTTSSFKMIPTTSMPGAVKSDGGKASQQKTAQETPPNPDVELIYEKLPSPDLVEKALSLSLSPYFYLYQSKPKSHTKCIGCEDENGDSLLPQEGDKSLNKESSHDISQRSESSYTRTPLGKGSKLIQVGLDGILMDKSTGENILFNERAKIYRFDPNTKEWKERGLGQMLVLSDPQIVNRTRLLFRREQIFKLACNHRIEPSLKLMPGPSVNSNLPALSPGGKPSQDGKGKNNTWSWRAVDFSEPDICGSEGIEEKFTVKFKNCEIAQKFGDIVDACKSGRTSKTLTINDVPNDPSLNRPRAPSESYQEEDSNHDINTFHSPSTEKVTPDMPATNPCFGNFDTFQKSISTGDSSRSDNFKFNTNFWATDGNDAKSIDSFIFKPLNKDTVIAQADSSSKNIFNATEASFFASSKLSLPPVTGKVPITVNAVTTSNPISFNFKPFSISKPLQDNIAVSDSSTLFTSADMGNQVKAATSSKTSGGFNTSNDSSFTAASSTLRDISYVKDDDGNAKNDKSLPIFGSILKTSSNFGDFSSFGSVPLDGKREVSFASLAAQPIKETGDVDTIKDKAYVGGAFTFGSGLSINKGINPELLKPKPMFGFKEKPIPQDQENETTEEDLNATELNIVNAPLVDLVPIVTGEENETAVFNERGKLYRFDSTTNEWKEKGVGQFKILKSIADHETIYRFLMRREKILKVACNHRLTSALKFQPFPQDIKGTSLSWQSMDYSGDSEHADEALEGKREFFTIRFKNKELMDKFKEIVEKCQEEIKAH
ncbi:unnamed protein product [Gordionus sp. m RMFG-2023]|uniref:uncharacterized protein LOC135922956 n=1 Tax=Gordionus sp. m RMFG-2023 TaxID=3053472 RepID=UPI0030E2C49A